MSKSGDGMGIILSITNFIKSLQEFIIAISVIIVTLSSFSWYEYGHWFEIWMAIPWYVYLAIIMVIIATILVANYRKKFFQKNSMPHVWGGVIGGSYELYGTQEYESVIWRIMIPTRNPYDLYWEPQKIEDCYKIESIPRCPKCKTELTQDMNFFSFKWHCVNCGYSRKSKLSFYVSKQNVMKIVRSQLEQMVDDERKRMI